MIETTLLDSIIVGRIDPHIYAFRTNTIPDYLKVGDTYRPVSVRIEEWKDYFPKLEHLTNWEWVAKTSDGKYFRDFAVHYYLEEIRHLHRLEREDLPQDTYYSREFFRHATPEDVDNAILDIERRANEVGGPYQFYTEDRLPQQLKYARTETYAPRPNQQDTIERFVEARRNGRRNLLMYAVMRFGKSFTSMCCATEMNAKTVLVVSAKVDVKSEWQRTVESHTRFADYVFLDSQALLTNTHAVTDLLQQGRCAAVFLTLQDLMGDDIKDKHEDIFRNQIDLLIVDETHFGARAEEYGKVLRNKDNDAEISKLNKQIEKESKTFEEIRFEDVCATELVKKLHVDTTLHLSGTPYRILMGSEFKPEDIIAFYQFTDIIDDKQEWDRVNLVDDIRQEWENPYYGFPQMVRFAFNPNESARRMLEQLKAQGKTASLTELFRPMSVSKDASPAEGHLHFVHEQEVLDLLRIIDGTKEDENVLGFLNYDKLREGNMCRHIVCVLPFCASCDAFAALLEKYKYEFQHLSEYAVVNISGIVGNAYRTPESIKRAIADYEAQDKKTITLTVNRMLTGSTVREWDTMLFLKDVSSPQEYDQAIFRLQNQYIKTYKDDSGEVIKYNMKPQTLLVDFDPNRMFVMQEQKSKIYNVNTDERGNGELEERIKKELQISPIIVINKGKIAEVQPTDIMDAVRQYSANCTVMDEAREIPTDFALLADPNIQLLIEGLEPINAQKGISIKPVEGEGEDYDSEPNLNDDGDTEPTPSDGSTPEMPETPKEKDDAGKRLATYFAQILFFALLTDDEVSSLADIVRVIGTDVNNQGIARHVGLKLQSLAYLYGHINPFILQDLDYKICNINELARDTSLEPLERVERALRKFGRLSISEIVTPSKVADDVVALLPEEGIDEHTRFLDIASKQAEFACALYRRFGDKVRNNIWSLPTSSLTYEFTRKVYKLLGLPLSNIYYTFNTYDLIGDNKETYTQILKDMKFNAVVGNPPYQESDGGGTGDSAKPIYNYFVDVAKSISPKYISMVLPSRWMKGGKGLVSFRKEMIEDTRLSKMIDYEDYKVLFPQSHIDGGVCYFLWDEGHNNAVQYDYYDMDNIKHSSLRYLAEGAMTKIIRDERQLSIIAAANTSKKFSANTSARKPYGFCADVFNHPERYSSITFYDYSAPSRVKLYGVLGTKGGAKRMYKYIDINQVPKNHSAISKWKLFFSKAYTTTATVPPAIIIGKPYEICSETFIEIGPFDTEAECVNCLSYIKTKFFRFLLFCNRHSLNISQSSFELIPAEDYNISSSDIDWNKSVDEIDQQLYAKYNLSADEIAFIESMIKPM